MMALAGVEPETLVSEPDALTTSAKHIKFSVLNSYNGHFSDLYKQFFIYNLLKIDLNLKLIHIEKTENLAKLPNF